MSDWSCATPVSICHFDGTGGAWRKISRRHYEILRAATLAQDDKEADCLPIAAVFAHLLN
jgi:hypothetical protein